MQVSPGGYFTLFLPDNMQGSSGWNGDGFMTSYSTGSIELSFVFSPYAGGTDEFSSRPVTFYPVRIDNQSATLAVGNVKDYRSNMPYLVAVFLPPLRNKPDWRLSLYSYGKHQSSQDTALAVFFSLHMTGKTEGLW